MDGIVLLCTEEKGVPQAEEEWRAALTNFTTLYAKSFDLKGLWETKDQILAIKYLTKIITVEGWSESVVHLVFTCIKIICRYQSNVRSVSPPETLAHVLAYVSKDGIDDKTRFEGLCVVLNILIINQRTNLDAFKNGLESFPCLLQLYATADVESQYVVGRILFYVALDDPLTEVFIEKGLVKTLVEEIVRDTNFKKEFEGFVDPESEESRLKRRRVAWALKILFNILMETKRPRMDTVHNYICYFI